MERLTPIPTPLPVRLRELRISYLPVLAFLAVAIGAVMLFREGGGGGVAGMAEGSPTLLSAPQGGVLSRVLVEPYQMVEAGQPVAVVTPNDSRAALDLLQMELSVARLRLEPTLAEDNALGFERIRVELLRTKSELAIARVNLKRAEQDVGRQTLLFREKLLARDLLEMSERNRDAILAEIEAKTAAVEVIERRLNDLTFLGVPERAPNALIGQMETLHRDALTNFAPVTLVAPRSGMVHQIYRQQGESIQPGELLFGISPLRSERIVAYLRQPYPVDLRVGMKVEAITREHRRRRFTSEVAQVGARVEVITNSLAFVRPNALVDAGLPFVVRLPADIDLRPGEVVDLHMWRGTDAPAASANQAAPGSVPAAEPLAGLVR